MRDLAIMMALPFLIYFSLKRPFIALSLWFWTSTFNINALVYSFAASITFVKLFMGTTVISLIKAKEKTILKINSTSALLILFYIVATLSNIGAIGDIDVAWERWTVYSKILLFYFFAIKIISKKIHIDLLIWVLIISVGAMASKEGVKFIISGGSHRIGGVVGITGDNNFFGVMIVTVIPLAVYLISQTKDKVLKMGLALVIFFMIMGLFATYSRGGFLGLMVCGIFFWKSSNKKMVWILLFSVIIYSLNNFMPEEWLSRMHSTENADADNSFMERIMAWKIGTLVAMDNILGGGFDCVINKKIWMMYSLKFDRLDFIPSPMPPIGMAFATHSMYFQVLSNHGFIGLTLFLMLLSSIMLKLSNILRLAEKNCFPDWIINLTKMLRLAILSYCVSGAAVNVAYMDTLYGIFAIFTVIETKIVPMIQQNE
jgi:probable O-glycosylation ligase (exosortase A-associated)